MRITPPIRISLGLVSLTISLLLLGKLIGFAPDRTQAILESRKNLSEALAIQFSAAAHKGALPVIKETLRSIVERENDIQSAALRGAHQELLAEAGNHLEHWHPPEDGRSTATHVQIPIFKGTQRWGTVEVSFAPLWANDTSAGFKNSYLSLILFVSFAGFAGYVLLIKRTLRELDPSAVIPGRVRAAFNVLEEGVLIFDEKEQIVLANSSFADVIGKSATELIGFKGSELGWKGYTTPDERSTLPWIQVLRGKQSVIGVRLVKKREETGEVTFMVNAAPVLDDKGKSRGVLVTFDDVTELEEKNVELNKTVNKLQLTTEEVQTKNRELEYLATHDPMTQLLNRRALNRSFSQAFSEARSHGTELSVIMCDIDHFKSVNDRYGHATGDEVIKMVARVLRKNTRENDLVGRYGGEEFCIVLPHLDINKAAATSERIRKAIMADTSSGVPITMSFGVSSLVMQANDHEELTNQADKALYIAKESGRNRVVGWEDDVVTEALPEAGSDSDVRSEPIELALDGDGVAIPMGAKVAEQESLSELEILTRRLHEMEELAQKRSFELEHLTTYDKLTGLPTRTLFQDRVTQALKRRERTDKIVAVLSVSVDAVQRVNEAFGHDCGEKLFKEISSRLSNTLRASDTVAKLPSASANPTVSRLGQEDIGVLLSELDDVNVITWIVKRILDEFNEVFRLENREIHATTHIGISISPYDGDSSEVLEKNAAIARSHARKQLGGNSYFFYSDNIQALSIKHLEMENQLHRAIANEEFLLHYQPKIETRTGNVIGMEALIRWQNPERGMVSPFEFIPIAEYSNLIDIIGGWVLAKACSQVRSWMDMGVENCSVAVNFSSKQFRQKNLAQKIQSVLVENRLEPSHLLVEVTESSMMENLGSSMKILSEIRDLGVGIALDDFGTGYSSLGYLKNFPVTHTKIDKSFINGIEEDEMDATLVHSIITMAQSMGLKVTAEGVENQQQVDLLQQFGCDELQGYHFSRPVPAHQATELLQIGRSDIFTSAAMLEIA